jgi:hypothetical protein
VPNLAYLSVWVRNFDETNMLSSFGKFLATIPVTATPPAFTQLVIRAVAPSEPLLEEHDLRSQGFTPADVVELAREHLAPDCSYELTARWDLWIRDIESGKWAKKPEKLIIFCNGLEYDNGIFAEFGNLAVDIGFEHIFTGHAGLLTGSSKPAAPPEDPNEARFLMWMSQPEHLREYQQKTRDNVQVLTGWVRAIEEALPIDRIRLWSEGEENFEAQLDQILAVR